MSEAEAKADEETASKKKRKNRRAYKSIQRMGSGTGTRKQSGRDGRHYTRRTDARIKSAAQVSRKSSLT